MTYVIERIKREKHNSDWWDIRIMSPSGQITRWLQWSQDEDELRRKTKDKVQALNEQYNNAAKRKPGWKKQRDNGTNQVYSKQGLKNRENKQKEIYKARVRAHFNERKAAKEAKEAKEAGRL